MFVAIETLFSQTQNALVRMDFDLKVLRRTCDLPDLVEISIASVSAQLAAATSFLPLF